ncbi:MAG: nucleotidyl transferase AbiEii/AbiGii toxin family protein [Candidatus Uhrbacteria bacterium]|nr:nucleotidyl transferase AbiEii/AbiGii toxin family protein [Candidatus Uhrbacteria bacterium]
MLNKIKHQLVMGQILRDIYSDTSISSLVGFKGGTSAYLFYRLSRFSVDLDFDLLQSDSPAQKRLHEKIQTILKTYGEVKDHCIKRNTIFFLLSYGDTDHNIKVEINTRASVPNIRDHFEMKEYLGISMLVGKKDYLFASKLAALTDRKTLAMRDIYDIRFFAKNNWDVNTEVIQMRTGKTLKKHLSDCVSVIEGVKDQEVLRGLGELLPDEKEKVWVKTHLRTETVFHLKNYMTALT